MLLGRVIDTGLVGTEVPFVRPRPVYSVVPFAPFAFPFICNTGAPSATADTTSGLGFDSKSSGFSSMGESGGGGISVPAVRESRGARTGSSNFIRDGVVPLGRVTEGMVVILYKGRSRQNPARMAVLGPECRANMNAEVNCSE